MLIAWHNRRCGQLLKANPFMSDYETFPLVVVYWIYIYMDILYMAVDSNSIKCDEHSPVLGSWEFDKACSLSWSILLL